MSALADSRHRPPKPVGRASNLGTGPEHHITTAVRFSDSEIIDEIDGEDPRAREGVLGRVIFSVMEAPLASSRRVEMVYETGGVCQMICVKREAGKWLPKIQPRRVEGGLGFDRIDMNGLD